MSEIGLIGFLLVTFIFFSVVYKSFKENYQKNIYSNKVIIAILFVFIAEIIPIRSSGSFLPRVMRLLFFYFTLFCSVQLKKNIEIER